MRRPLLLAAALLAAAAALAAQDSGSASSSDDELFGAESVTETKQAEAAAPQDDFLKYEAVRIGGSLSGSLGWSATWLDPWKSGVDPLDPDSKALKPALSGTVKLAAKPSADFGVNMEFRSSWPFSRSTTVDTGATDDFLTPGIDESKTTVSTTNLSIWSLYSKFSWRDALFFSFGKQPLSWGVSRSFFQPADDIFALSNVDLADTGAEREGPIVFKAQYPLPLTMANAYFYAGVPDGTALGLEDLRLAAKAEGSFGNTELAAGAYYSYDDHPRVLLMGTTGTGDFNFFGELVGKWGSERYFIEKNGLGIPVGAQKADQAWLSGTLGGYYTNSDWNVMVSAAYYYNGEGQTGVDAQTAYGYYFMNQSEIDRMKFGTHYAALSFSKQELLVDELSFMVYGIANLVDFSVLAAPSLTWKLFDYASLKVGGMVTFGDPGSEYTMAGGGTPSASLDISFTLGSGSF